MQLSQGELHALRAAAERAWDDDTRHPAYSGHPLRSAGQCYVTSRWLADRLGGHVARKNGHYFFVDPDERHGLDLTGDQFHEPPIDPKLADSVEPDDDGVGFIMEDHHKTWRPGPVIYKETSHPYFSGYEIVPPVKDEQAERFGKRADRIFDNPDALLKEADLAGDAYPAETPQAIADMGQRYFHAEPGFQPETAEYKFVYANGQLEVSPDHDHEQLAGHAGIAPEHTGPVAMGTIVVDRGQARFEVTGNISARALSRVLKDYAKHVGWKWGGLTDIDGWPISDEFAAQRRSRLYFSWRDGHLNLSKAFRPVASTKSRIIGYLDIDEIDLRVRVVPTRLPEYFASLRRVAHDDMVALGTAVLDWATDNGFTVVGLHDNVIKTIEDLSEHNLYDPSPAQPDEQQYPARPTDERQPGGVYRCPECDVIFPTWSSYQEHRRNEEPFGDDPVQDSGFPEEPALGTIEQHPYVSMTTVKQASRVPGFQGHQEGDQYAVAYRHGCALGYARLRDGKLNEIRTVNSSVELPLLLKLVRVADKAPKDMLEGPIPFIYDVQEDKLDFGQPNTRISDIPGQFTPGGIVEGIYEPSGKVLIRSVTNQPYTVRHLLELWYATNPMLEVRSVFLQDDAGRATKLAGA